jgi:hypothetical protein
MAAAAAAAADAACALSSLPHATLHVIASAHLSGRDVAALACACTALRAALADDGLWHTLCARDWECTRCAAPEGAATSSYRSAYAAWHAAFGAYGPPLFLRARRAVARLRGALRR